MSSVINLTEELLFECITKTLSMNDIKQIYNGNDILNSLSYDAEEDIKERIWEVIKQEINYRNIVQEIKDWLKIYLESENEEEEDISNNESSEEE